MTVIVPGGTLRLNRRRVTALSWIEEAAAGVTGIGRMRYHDSGGGLDFWDFKIFLLSGAGVIPPDGAALQFIDYTKEGSTQEITNDQAYKNPLSWDIATDPLTDGNPVDTGSDSACLSYDASAYSRVDIYTQSGFHSGTGVFTNSHFPDTWKMTAPIPGAGFGDKPDPDDWYVEWTRGDFICGGAAYPGETFLEYTFYELLSAPLTN